MHMLLLIGVSIGFALSVLTHNNFYSEKTFTSSVNSLKNFYSEKTFTSSVNSLKNQTNLKAQNKGLK